MLHQDLQDADVPLWGYFCQISDSTTSYGSYSGAVPNEKITWGKLGSTRRSYIIESDATIVAPARVREGAWLVALPRFSLFPVFADLTPASRPAKNRSHENSLPIRNRFSGDDVAYRVRLRPGQNSHARRRGRHLECGPGRARHATDDEANDGAREVEREPQTTDQPQRHLGFHRQVVDGRRYQQETGRIKRNRRAENRSWMDAMSPWM